MLEAQSSFLAAFRSGEVCLHPTDSIPGLTFDPISGRGLDRLKAIKGSRVGKSFVCLVAGVDQALTYWQSLPTGWERVLKKAWPGSLSVIWQARHGLPSSLCHDDGTICLRVPELPAEAAWFKTVLIEMDQPLPSTSVNSAGEPPYSDWHGAARYLSSQNGCHIPNMNPSPSLSIPSTLIKIHLDGTFDLLRAGPVAEHVIKQLLVEQE
jgi:L-threonylcarbamoyladenylate synthase